MADVPHLYPGMGERAALRVLPAVVDQVRAGSRPDIELRGCGLTAVPEALRGLGRLVRLDLSGNRLAALPDWLGELTGLEVLSLNGNRIGALPASVGALTRLRVLQIDHNRLTALPDALASLTRLRALRLSGNRLATVPPVLCRLPGLQALSLARNGLSAVPGALGALPELVRLDLTDNRLTSVPERLSRLPALETGGNPMSPWPAPPPQTLGLERRSAQYNLVVGGLMGWAAWRGGKDGIDDAAYAVSRLPYLTGEERTDAEDLAISLVREGGTAFAHVLGRARCTRALPLLRDIATDPSTPALRRLQAAQGLILMDPTAGRAAATGIAHDPGADRITREDARRLLTGSGDGLEPPGGGGGGAVGQPGA